MWLFLKLNLMCVTFGCAETPSVCAGTKSKRKHAVLTTRTCRHDINIKCDPQLSFFFFFFEGGCIAKRDDHNSCRLVNVFSLYATTVYLPQKLWLETTQNTKRKATLCFSGAALSCHSRFWCQYYRRCFYARLWPAVPGLFLCRCWRWSLLERGENQKMDTSTFFIFKIITILAVSFISVINS